MRALYLVIRVSYGRWTLRSCWSRSSRICRSNSSPVCWRETICASREARSVAVRLTCTFRMVLLQEMPQVVVVQAMLFGNGQQRLCTGLILLPRFGILLLLLRQLHGAHLPRHLHALRPSRKPVRGNPAPHRIPLDSQLRRYGLIALPLPGKRYRLLPQGIRISYAAGHLR